MSKVDVLLLYVAAKMCSLRIHEKRFSFEK